ncbi:hypothetical protein COO60DRAFT_1458231 [Scenedesmus sp. NREL 46B-D3]|nr:hypothetical protein COO60DRAFT_1458231 [Scenedesmus sp. NREL 46B-D3]
MLRPTDPLWGAARGPLRVTGLVNPNTYPAAGGISLSIQPSRGVTAAEPGVDVLLRPRFVHEGSNVLAGLRLQGCRPLDLLPSVYGATCADCDAVGALRALQVGVPASRKCSHCHRTMGCSIPSASFLPRGPPKSGSAAAAGGGRGPRLRKTGGAKGGGGAGVLQEGSPLPHNGACKHYRHSYRWLRFPCWGSATHATSVMRRRQQTGTMQPLDKACRHCGKRLASSAAQPTGRNTQFWEGGKGCRDVKRLDRRDAHKYRNSKAKTKSAKAKRVGPKAWSGTAGAAAGGSGGTSS